jgi:hypothetical protein
MNSLGLSTEFNQSEPECFTAINLLDQINDFKNIYVPNLEEWDEEKLISNPPRYFRYLRIKALCKAFFGNDKNDTILSIISGDFIETKEIPEYSIVFERILRSKKVNERKWERKFIDEANEYLNHRMLFILFKGLIEFKKRLDLLMIYDGYSDSSPRIFFQYIYDITHEIIGTLDKNKIQDLFDLLELILNPSQKTFNRKQLEENYGFPKVDINEIDADWF